MSDPEGVRFYKSTIRHIAEGITTVSEMLLKDPDASFDGTPAAKEKLLADGLIEVLNERGFPEYKITEAGQNYLDIINPPEDSSESNT